MASSAGVAMLVSTAAASSNGRFAGSSAAELEEWLVRNMHIRLSAHDIQFNSADCHVSPSAHVQALSCSILVCSNRSLVLLGLLGKACCGSRLCAESAPQDITSSSTRHAADHHGPGQLLGC
jgi:hypothetical protein